MDDTIIIFTTDNGGQTHQGSRNWPLRGNKGTVFEGGVRGTGFVWGSKLPKLNYDNHQLIIYNSCNRLVTDNSRRYCWSGAGYRQMEVRWIQCVVLYC